MNMSGGGGTPILQVAYPEIFPLTVLIACNAMN